LSKAAKKRAATLVDFLQRQASLSWDNGFPSDCAASTVCFNTMLMMLTTAAAVTGDGLGGTAALARGFLRVSWCRARLLARGWRITIARWFRGVSAVAWGL